MCLHNAPPKQKAATHHTPHFEALSVGQFKDGKGSSIPQHVLQLPYYSLRTNDECVWGLLYITMIKGVETSHCLDSGKLEAEFFITHVWHALGLKAVYFGQKQHFLQQK